MKVQYERTNTIEVNYHVLEDGTIVEETIDIGGMNNRRIICEGKAENGEIRIYQSAQHYHVIPAFALHEIRNNRNCYPNEIARMEKRYFGK